MIHSYKTLYSKDTSGNIRVWLMEKNTNYYRTVSGVLNGNLVTSEWTETLGKNIGKTNETSDEEQTIKDIESQYKKKLKTGYFENINDIDKIQFIEPMLAKNYKDYKGKIDFSKNDWIIQCKLNGSRAIAVKSGIFTRKGEKYLSVPHIEESLKPFFNEYPDAALDGEFFNNSLRENLNELMSIVRRTVNITEEDIQKSKNIVQYHIYDGFNFGHNLEEKSPYSFRKYFINQVCLSLPYLKKVYDYSVNNEEDLEYWFNSFLKDKQEGLILRDVTKGYERKRSKNLLKYKPVNSSECIIQSINEGEGNWSGKAKIVTVNWQGKVFDITFKGNMEDAIQMLCDSDKWIGKEVTFEYYGLTGLGTPNYGQLDYRNCLKT